MITKNRQGQRQKHKGKLERRTRKENKSTVQHHLVNITPLTHETRGTRLNKGRNDETNQEKNKDTDVNEKY